MARLPHTTEDSIALTRKLGGVGGLTLVHDVTADPGYRQAVAFGSLTNIVGLSLDRGQDVPLHRQVYEQIRAAILGGQLQRDARLPSTRDLATELRVSRNTITRAYEQLVGEGYLTSIVGSGTRVNGDLPVEMPEFSPAQGAVDNERILPRLQPRLSSKGSRLVELKQDSARAYEAFLHSKKLRAFTPGVPALDAFPMRLWERSVQRAWKSLSAENLVYPPALGYMPLRESIAAHMRSSRGVHCEAERVVITSGTQESLSLITSVLLDPGDVAWVENPSFPGILALLRAGDIDVEAIPVDGEGLMVDRALEQAPNARLAYISPSHQYPLGMTMSLSRRLKLLEWARESEAWIVEDDYDSEFTFSGYPLQALQGLDISGRVIYTGTFSKSMFPALRIGYLVAPESLLDSFRAAHAFLVRGVGLLSQVALHRFFADGHFARHIRRMRSLYARRQQVLATELKDKLRGLLDPTWSQTGMHLIGWLADGVHDGTLSASLSDAGIDAPALSSLAVAPIDRPGLVLGYTTPEAEMIKAVSVMGRVIRELV